MSKALVKAKAGVDADLDESAVRITKAMNDTVEGVFAVGRELAKAKKKHEHGQFMRLFDEQRVQMSYDAANRYMAIWAARPRLQSSDTVRYLPSSYATLYALAQLPEDTLAWALAERKVTPELTRAAVPKLRESFYELHPDARPPAKPERKPRATPTRADAESYRLFIDKLTVETAEGLDRLQARWPVDAMSGFIDCLRLHLNAVTAKAA